MYSTPYDYGDNLYELRSFQGLIGQIFTIPAPLTLPDGRGLPAGTRVFIHRVDFSPPAFIEMVTIVVPLPGFIPGTCMVGTAQVSASQLNGSGPGTFGTGTIPGTSAGPGTFGTGPFQGGVGTYSGSPYGGTPPRPPRPPR